MVLLGRLSVAGVMTGWKRFPAEWLKPVTEVTATSGYLLQAALGTTVIPLCGPGEMENCTTALIQTENSPRVAQVGITRCKPEMKDYCFHGQCVYIVDLDEHYCRCDVGFSGVRCVHSELVRQPLSKEYVALTVIVVLLFVAAISLASYYIYRRQTYLPTGRL
ncbi:proepiregulin isoform X3 [Manacus candei]|uniref:proepiregulin isoform X3 n=1 Tax=Manacus candei TaxID=415023 RepID=UPI002227D1B5|nr:proepiregulin isoform X3 [Manacus candei]